MIMAIGALSVGLTLASLGLSAYSKNVQAKTMEKQGKVAEAQRNLNVTKYGMDLQGQRKGVLTEAKMALSQVEQAKAKSTWGANTATQAFTQGIIGDVEASERNITRNMQDAKFNAKVANTNTNIQIANARANNGLKFLGETLSGVGGLYQAHRADVRGQKQEDAMRAQVEKSESQVGNILDEMKY